MISFKAKVISGRKVGRKLGFPTANLDKKKLNVGYGVYLVRVEIKNKEYDGLLHFGPRKTFNQGVSLELHVKDFKSDIYGEQIKVKIIRKIRNVRKFKNKKELIGQIKKDLESIKKNQIETAAVILKSGGVIAYPTETVYGLGADIFNQKAVRRVFEIKGRDFKKPLSVAVSGFEMMKKIVKTDERMIKILKKILPGPFTVILPKKRIVSDIITAGKKLVGIRFPEQKEAIAIIKKAGFPITSTSANLSGKKEITESKNMNLAVDFIVDGKCKYKRSSTILDLVNGKIVRKGAGFLKAKKILKEFIK